VKSENKLIAPREAKIFLDLEPNIPCVSNRKAKVYLDLNKNTPNLDVGTK